MRKPDDLIASNLQWTVKSLTGAMTYDKPLMEVGKEFPCSKQAMGFPLKNLSVFQAL